MRLLRLLLPLLLLVTACAGSDPTPATTTPTRTATPEIGISLVTRAPATVAIVRTTPTALPTATATPTPTPIIYTIAEGDTLLGIAIDNLTTVDEIKALNPGVVPELLQIGSQLQLPPPATAIFQGTRSTPIPLQVVVDQVNFYRTPVGSLWVLGEVVNEGEFAAADIQVQIDFPSGGQSLAIPAWVQPPLLPAGDRAPFAALVREAPESESMPAVSIVGGAPLLDAGSHYLDLASGVTEATIEDDYVSLTGTITNTGELTANTISVVAIFYDSQGRVSGYSQQQLPGPLPPGETAPFALDGTPPGAPVVEYRLLVQGLAETPAAAP
ncbi:MAG: LysM peptidoglycan-binding domain-containing protein [Chloroflexi bacterium]|nr:LysM peptidoglycan-binding domain-containing protein [Chloroflexota bacterium]